MKRIKKLGLIVVFAYVPFLLGAQIDTDINKIVDLNYSDFCNCVDNERDYNRLRILAIKTFENSYYKKTYYVYERLIDFHIIKLNELDALKYYYTLLKLKQEDKIPIALLEKFNELPNVQKIIEVADYIKQYKPDTVSSVSKKKHNDIKLVPEYGLRSFEKTLSYTKSMDKNQLGIVKINFNNESYIEESIIFPEKLKKHLVLSKITIPDKGEIYCIISEKNFPENIITDGNLPEFKFNSRTYACAMPFFDVLNNRLYFCSDMPGGFGGWDIYYCVLEKSGWSRPVNLGGDVNTWADEIFPFIYRGTLVFSSDIRKGTGGFDNYEYSFENCSITDLFDFNTPDDDYSLIFPSDTINYAYGISNSKIISFYKKVSPRDSIINTVNKLVSDHSIPVYIAEENDIIDSIEVIDNFNYSDSIFFAYDKFYFEEQYYPYLDSCFEYLNKNENGITTVIFAEADKEGSDKYNYNLSYNRAIEVNKYFQKRNSDINSTIIILGELLSGRSKNNAKNRIAFIKEVEYQFKHKLIMAVPVSRYKSLDEVASVFNNPINELKAMNKVLQEEYPEVYFVGIQDVYKIKAGDNLYRIGINNGITCTSIIKANFRELINYIPDEVLIIPGDFLVIPLKNDNKE